MKYILYIDVPARRLYNMLLQHSSFQDRLIFALVFLRFLRITWDYFVFPLRGFPSAGKMAGIVNSSQHCYFNSLFQCLANSSRIYDYLDEHEREIRNVVGEPTPSVTLVIRH